MNLNMLALFAVGHWETVNKTPLRLVCYTCEDGHSLKVTGHF